MTSRRLQKELADIRVKELPFFINLQVDESNLLEWRGLLIPSSPPYNKGAFVIEITFPPEYPFKPPKVIFKTKIYHPNVGEDGTVCVSLLHTDNWKPSTKIEQVLEAVASMVDCPQPDHPMRAQLAEEYIKNKKKFLKNAEEFTIKYAEKKGKSS